MDEMEMNEALEGAPQGEETGAPEAPAEASAPVPRVGEEEVREQMRRISAMDPEVHSLADILRSECAPRFRAYVAKGLDFVDAYTLAAGEKLRSLREQSTQEAAARTRAASKAHLSATTQRGEGALPVPPDEMALIREFLPEATDGEIRKYYGRDKKRFG